MEIVAANFAETLDLYTKDYKYIFNKYLDHKISNDFNGAIENITVMSFYLTNDILNVPKRNITYQNLFSILNVHHKNRNSLIDMEVLNLEQKTLFFNVFNINKFQEIGWIYIMHLNEKLIFNNFKDKTSQLPEICLKQSIRFNIYTQNNDWKAFNRRLSKMDVNTKFTNQICSGVDQACCRVFEILEKYDDLKWLI